jgi:hypothetical protein
VGVGWSGESGGQWWCEFNALFLTREMRRQDEALLKDETEATSSS